MICTQFYDVLVNEDDTNAVTVNDQAKLEGGTVNVRAGDGSVETLRRTKILSAGESLTGNFSHLNSDFVFLNSSLAYEENDVYLDLACSSVGDVDVADTHNQRMVGQYSEQVKLFADVQGRFGARDRAVGMSMGMRMRW